MSRQYNEFYFSLPEPVRELYFEEPIDYESDETEWRPIYGWPGYYISRYGEVLSLYHSKPRILATWPNQYGHRYVQLKNNYGGRRVSVHRLVAEAFIPNPYKYPVVMHLDDNPENNYVENLCWGTQNDNMRQCCDRDRNFTRRVYCFELNRSFKSCAQAADYFGVTKSLITIACENKVGSIKGKYHLCYEEDYESKVNDVSWRMKNSNYKPLKATSVSTGNTLYFLSRKDASEYLGISDSGISSCIVRRINQSGGWIFDNCSYEEGDGLWINP